MNLMKADQIRNAVTELTPDAISLLQELVRFPSVNHPPYGDEKAVQKFYSQ